MRAFIALLVLTELTPPLSPGQQAEIRSVEERLLAPCCYSQSIAQHGSEIAGQMRNEVVQLVAEGQSEEQIIDHYKQIYGERILVVPDGATGEILFTTPVLIFAVACLLVSLYLRKMLRKHAKKLAVTETQFPSLVDSDLRKRVERETGDPF